MGDHGGVGHQTGSEDISGKGEAVITERGVPAGATARSTIQESYCLSHMRVGKSPGVPSAPHVAGRPSFKRTFVLEAPVPFEQKRKAALLTFLASPPLLPYIHSATFASEQVSYARLFR